MWFTAMMFVIKGVRDNLGAHSGICTQWQNGQQLETMNSF